MKLKLTVAVIAATFACAAQAQLKPAEQIKFRQAGYHFMKWNMGKIKMNLDGEYNKDQVAAAANVIAAISKSGMGALYGPGTEKGTGFEKTLAKPELFKNMDEVKKLAGNFGAAADELAKAAGSGDKAAVKEAFGKVGETCKACHDKFREKDKH